MSGQTEFLGKLEGLMNQAREQGSQITAEEVKAYFSEDALTEEQTELVFEYLMAQKVAVRGYVKMAPETDGADYTEEEKRYLEEYRRDLQAIRPADAKELRQLHRQAANGEEASRGRLVEVYLKEIVDLAEQMHRPDVFIGDLIQEGNLGLVLGAEVVTDPELARETLLAQARQSMQVLLEAQTECSSRDKKMVEKVQTLDDTIRSLTKELGRKVTMDELAAYMGTEIEEIENILKLTGEEKDDGDLI